MEDGERDEREVDPALGVVDALLDNEYSFEWQRKQSFETRCFAIVTADIALLTVAVVIGDRVGLLDQLDGGKPRLYGILALVAASVSVIASIVGAFPFKYSALDASTIGGLLDRVDEIPETPEDVDTSLADDLAMALARSKVIQLGEAKRSNKAKGIATFAAFVAAVAVLVLVSLAMGFAVHSGTVG